MRPIDMAIAPFAGSDTEMTLGSQVAFLTDLAAIQRLKTAFVTACDPYEPAMFASLFAEEGVYTSSEYGT
ncbi:nuclear transport factor 2 family protein [Komagataeibacter sp. FNDCF1]|uniref:nuclear transport factor 2 family protein n=1 Tax=Komagataeibacter sp. FNDCF1 TaxID=2878681 RepID=UPI001E380D74|nr:nuclear transport factor 2 family protein [Komagataeibacter sp. FNDCF1]MCE2565260.1 nuclear transport factor 2 family protein [Komagataeibacter sp. FNDCF1]